MMDRLFRLVIRQGWRRGVLGDSRFFLAAGALALLGQFARRHRAKSEVVFSERLRPGEAFRIFHEPRP